MLRIQLGTTEFVHPRQDDRPCLDHEFECFLHDNDIEHTLCKVGRPQSSGKIERFFQTYEKHRQRFGTLDKFPHLLQRGATAYEPWLGRAGDASRGVRAVGAIASERRWRPARNHGNCRWMTEEIFTGQHISVLKTNQS